MRFGVLTEFDSMSDEDIKNAMERLIDLSKRSLFRILLRILSVYFLVQGTVKKYSRKE